METAGTVPASKVSPFVFSRLSGGGGGSRTRVRKRSAWDVYVRSFIGGCSRRWRAVHDCDAPRFRQARLEFISRRPVGRFDAVR